jgi:hypothetical protein
LAIRVITCCPWIATACDNLGCYNAVGCAVWIILSFILAVLNVYSINTVDTTVLFILMLHASTQNGHHYGRNISMGMEGLKTFVIPFVTIYAVVLKFPLMYSRSCVI